MEPYTLDTMFKEAGIADTIPFAPFIPMQFKGDSTRPYKVQVQNLALAYHHNWWALYWEPGTGKTLVAQALSLLYIGTGNKVLVVTLASLIYQFKEDLEFTFQGIGKYVAPEIFDYGPKEKSKRFEEFDRNGWPAMLVMGYERFLEHGALFKGKGYNVLIADESWRLSNFQAKTYCMAKDFRGNPGDSGLLLMNGTPISKDLTSLYGNISLVDPEAYESYDHFESKHVIKRRMKLRTPIKMKSGKKLSSILQVVGFRNHALAYRNMYHRGSRVLKIDVAEIKKPVIIDLPVRLHPDHLKLYKKLATERILELSDEEIITAVNEQSLRQKIMQLITVPEIFLPPETRIENRITGAIEDIIDSVDLSESKMILFCNFQETIRTFNRKYERYNPALLYGENSPKQRKDNEEKFKHDDSCRLGIFNPRSAGAGFNFQEVCSYIIFTEPFSSPGPFKQAMDRIVRPGQKYTPTIWLLRALSTFASKRVDSLLDREGQAQQVYRDRESLLDYYVRG